MASSKRVVLCADDFGLSEGVSAGILDLVHGGRISATSALTNRPGWDRHAPDLRAEGGRIGVGLHFNLTYGAPLGPMPQWAPRGRFPNVGVVTRRALTGSLPLREIEAELKRQLEAFTTGFGRGPDFVDGHQHVHALPGIRAVVLAVLAARAGPRPWLRDPTASLGVLLGQPTLAKAAAVGALSLGFRGSARRAGFETNEGFSGFSAFDRDPDVSGLFERAFERLGPRPLVMCHPGRREAGPDAVDEVVESRPRELAYLLSPAFGELLERRHLILVPRPSGGEPSPTAV